VTLADGEVRTIFFVLRADHLKTPKLLIEVMRKKGLLPVAGHQVQIWMTSTRQYIAKLTEKPMVVQTEVLSNKYVSACVEIAKLRDTLALRDEEISHLRQNKTVAQLSQTSEEEDKQMSNELKKFFEQLGCL